MEADDGSSHAFKDGVEAEVEVVSSLPELVGFEVVGVHEDIEDFHVGSLHIAQTSGQLSQGGVLHEGRLLDISEQARGDNQ